MHVAARISWATSDRIRKTMQNTASRDTKPELALRSELHRRGRRFRVCARPIPEMRRTADGSGRAWSIRSLPARLRAACPRPRDRAFPPAFESRPRAAAGVRRSLQQVEILQHDPKVTANVMAANRKPSTPSSWPRASPCDSEPTSEVALSTLLPLSSRVSACALSLPQMLSTKLRTRATFPAAHLGACARRPPNGRDAFSRAQVTRTDGPSPVTRRGTPHSPWSN
jgi:DNA mismatch endonuclease Vsr